MDCLCISGEEFDRNNGLLNCINGTLELSSLTFRKHRADDLITKMCNVVYDSTAASEIAIIYYAIIYFLLKLCMLK